MQPVFGLYLISQGVTQGMKHKIGLIINLIWCLFMVIPPFLEGVQSRIFLVLLFKLSRAMARDNFCLGVMPPIAML